MSKLIADPRVRRAAETVMQRCEYMARISELPGRVARYYLTPQHKQANHVMADWMRAAGMTTWQDSAANIWGRYPSVAENAPCVVLGSHLDTVTNAGKYDGILGVLTAIAVVELLHARRVSLPFHIDVVGFGDEEGTRFGTTLLGSRAVAGQWQQAWLQLQDKNAVSLQNALETFGLSPQAVADASRANDAILAYLELHIEQGPVLESKQLPLGIVTAIAGAKRLRFTVRGMAGHAGTVPMAMRQDALVAACLSVAQIETLAIQHGVVATVGELAVSPGAVNVIPGTCQFSLDIRSANDAARERALKHIIDAVQRVCAERGVAVTHEVFHQAASVQCAGWLQTAMEKVITQAGLPPERLPSGAGHDAMVFGDITDVGMLFLRCAGGISHHPLESVSLADVEQGLAIFFALVLNLKPPK